MKDVAKKMHTIVFGQELGPRCEHDCPLCRFLGRCNISQPGQYDRYDLYFCKDPATQHGKPMHPVYQYIPAIVARYGDGDNYVVGLGGHPALEKGVKEVERLCWHQWLPVA